LQHWLRRNGIPAEVLGDLMVARGDLPIQESSPTVWVPEAFAADARVLVEEFEVPTGDGKRWACAACGEDNEPNFGTCWNCSVDRAT
jgi:hypothetical protein